MAATLSIEAPASARLAVTDPTQLAVAGFQAQYRGETAHAVYYDLKHYLGWCMSNALPPLAVTRPHLELYERHLEKYVSYRTRRPLRPATIFRMTGTVLRFYTYATDEGFIEKDPGARIKRHAVSFDDQARTFLMPLEFAALLTAARARPMDHALVALLGMLGLRISEATQLDIDGNVRRQGGYDVLHFIGKGAKPATVPMPIPVWRAVDTAIAGRSEGPVLLNTIGKRMTRSDAARALDRLQQAAALTTRVTPHSLRRTYITGGLIAGIPLRDMQIAARHEDPRTTSRYDMAKANLDRHASHRVASYLAGMT